MPIELTDTQRERLEQIKNKWTGIAASTETIDRDAAAAAIAAAYAQINRPMPPIDWQPSPRAGMLARARWMTLFPKPNDPGRPVTPDEFAAVQKITDDEAKAKRGGWTDARLGGNTWAGWHAYAEALRFLDVPGIEAVDAYNAVAEQVGWWWPYAEVCIVCDRPEILRFDERRRLHAENGPAMRWRDGWSIWEWHGIEVTEDVIMGRFTAEDFLGERNAEVRRVMAEVKGWEWVLDELGATRLDSDEYGTKWVVDLNRGLPNDFGDDDDERAGTALLVEVLNSTPEPDGTIKRYFLSVNPDECHNLPPKDCIGWTFGLAPGQYAPEVMT